MRGLMKGCSITFTHSAGSGLFQTVHRMARRTCCGTPPAESYEQKRGMMGGRDVIDRDEKAHPGVMKSAREDLHVAR